MLSDKQQENAMPKGLYRIVNGWGNQDSVRVKYNDGKELEIPLSTYVANGYSPSAESLPKHTSDGKP